MLTKRGAGISFLHTSSRGTPNLTFSSLRGYGPEGCPQEVTTFPKVAARLCILAAQLLISKKIFGVCRKLKCSLEHNLNSGTFKHHCTAKTKLFNFINTKHCTYTHL